MRGFFTLILVLVIISSCTQDNTKPIKIVTSTASTTTITVLQTTTVSTTTTTSLPFDVPKYGELCADVYSPELINICGETVRYAVIVPDLDQPYRECSLVGKYGLNDMLFIKVLNYNEPPLSGLNPAIQPVFTWKRNIAVNETGEISARYQDGKYNAVQLVQDGLLVEVKASNKTCTSLDALDIAKIVTGNIQR